jgi:hypothetical protein
MVNGALASFPSEADMFPDHGCHGEVALGNLPDEVRKDLAELPGEWLEYDPERSVVVKRHAQPSSGPDLPVITGELVQILAVVPPDLHQAIPGGDFFVHTSDTKQFVRLHVQPGGVLELQWAHPDFASASRSPYKGRSDTPLDPYYHRLNGTVTFRGRDKDAAARVLELADTWEGLYPEGDCKVVEEGDLTRLELIDLNLDAHLLVDRLLEVAETKTLDGGFVVTAFGREVRPEDSLRVLFDVGEVYVQHPVLWPDTAHA